jgi:hypothetical protein
MSDVHRHYPRDLRLAPKRNGRRAATKEDGTRTISSQQAGLYALRAAVVDPIASRGFRPAVGRHRAR